MVPKGTRAATCCMLALTNCSSETFTGRRLAPALLFKRPCRYCLRQVKTRFGFNAYCCATRGTDVPGSKVSRTILCFSSIVQRRRFVPCLEVSTYRLVGTKQVST